MSADYAQHQGDMERYLAEGEIKAYELGNRGPVRYDRNGNLHEEILAAYWQCGFYIFEGIFEPEELSEIETDVFNIIDRLPVKKGSPVDKKGRPALGINCQAPTLFWSKPLGDPFGGTDLANGRHPVKMFEPTPLQESPEEIVYLILGSLQFSEACLRAYGHPDLLSICAGVNGKDFVPFTDAIFIKEPGLGASVAWHQDGVTHWDSDDWDLGSHGFNIMAQLYGCTPANGVWIVPGSHKSGRVDIKAMVEKAGSERLTEAVPMICKPGDVAIANRQALHGSFANTSPDWRVTLNFGCHRRSSILGVEGGGLHNTRAIYDDARIRERSRLIAYAIDARRQHFSKETPFVYEPFIKSGDTFVWDEAARKSLHDYNLLDLGI